MGKDVNLQLIINVFQCFICGKKTNVLYLGACGDIDYPAIFVRLDDPDVLKFVAQVIHAQNDTGTSFILVIYFLHRRI